MLLLGKIIMLFRELKQLTLKVVFYENATTIKIVFEINQQQQQTHLILFLQKVLIKI